MRSEICELLYFYSIISLKATSGFYIAGIMMYKLGLEFFNGSIATLATDRFKAAATFTKRKAVFFCSQIYSNLYISS